jgi:hypothetical protein
LLAEIRKLDAAVFAIVQAGQISQHQRNVASERLTQARMVAERGRTDEARQMLARVADMVAGWQEPQD